MPKIIELRQCSLEPELATLALFEGHDVVSAVRTAVQSRRWRRLCFTAV